MVKAVVGANWGDEGKGKITDMLAREADIVIRFQGGANAGHTIVNNYGKFAFAYTSVRCVLQSYHQYYWEWCGVKYSCFNAGDKFHHEQKCTNAKNFGFGQGADCNAISYTF